MNRSFNMEPIQVDPSILTTTASGQNLGWSDIKAWRGSQAYTNDVALQSPGRRPQRARRDRRQLRSPSAVARIWLVQLKRKTRLRTAAVPRVEIPSSERRGLKYEALLAPIGTFYYLSAGVATSRTPVPSVSVAWKKTCPRSLVAAPLMGEGGEARRHCIRESQPSDCAHPGNGSTGPGHEVQRAS